MKLLAGKNVPGCPYSLLPYYLVRDEIFPLKSWLMKPFPGKFNKEQHFHNNRHSRRRRVIENSFGIFRARYRLFSKQIKANVENVENYVCAVIYLHNYLRLMENPTYTSEGCVNDRSS